MGSLLRQFKDGDSAVTQQIRQRVGRILGFRLFGIPHEDRLDLEQKIMIQLWEATTRPEFSGDDFWGFVETVTSRRCIDWLRTRKPIVDNELLQEIIDTREEPLRRTLRRERMELADAALARLPEACRELIRLHAGQNRTYGEISEILGKSEAALRVQMHRCIKRAQEILHQISNSKDSR